MSFQATIGVDLAVVAPVNQSMMLMQLVEPMIDAIEVIEVDVNVTMNFSGAYAQR